MTVPASHLTFLVLLAAPLAFAAAPESIEGVEVETQDTRDIREYTTVLQNDSGKADLLARRILRSRLAERISAAEDEEQRLAEILRWIDSNRKAAATLGLGLAKDDASGTTAYEDLMLHQANFVMVENPNAVKGLYGRLKKTGQEHTGITKDPELADEQKTEKIKNLFEGEGNMAEKVLDFDKNDKAAKAAEEEKAAAGVPGDFYDRLGQGNLAGYSPQVMTIQSYLNGRRAPGAPRLIETGRLDYETLAYPLYGMRYDLENLKKKLTYEINLALVRLLGEEGKYRTQELADERLTEKLRAQALGRARLNPRLEKRLRILQRLAAALADFEKTAALARDPAKITRALLAALGGKQREAARWITIASIEEELTRLEAEEGFLTPELLAAIAAAPVEPQTISAYKRRGEDFKSKLALIKGSGAKAVESLESDGWVRYMTTIEATLARNAVLRRDLSRDIANYVRTPFRLREAHIPKPRWRALIERMIARFLPSTAAARRILAEGRRLSLLKEVFHRIASGDLNGAHRALESERA